jgi:hypothetical protein
MDVSRILAELRAERAQLEEAILSLERLARGRGKRRGRPPSWLADRAVNGASNGAVEGAAEDASVQEAPKRRGRPPGSKNKSIATMTIGSVA